MKRFVRMAAVLLPLLLASGCAGVDVPEGRTLSVPTVAPPLDRYQGLNEPRDPVTRVKLGRDVLVPQRMADDPLPEEDVGPFELRNETLASALQLITDDYDISLAFESDSAMTTRISVANLRGRMSQVIDKVCQLANLYCRFKDGVLTVKDTETFVVDLPPLGGTSSSSSTSSDSGSNSNTSNSSTGSGGYEQIVTGLEAVLNGASNGTSSTSSSSSNTSNSNNSGNSNSGSSNGAPVVDSTTRVIIYTATQRSQKYAEKYFERLRKNTALIVYETHIWEVTLDNNNRTGIDWSVLMKGGNFSLNIESPGGAPDGTAAPIAITPDFTGSKWLNPATVLEFISEHGTVKTVSQPQLTVLSGASASLEVQQNENFVSGVQRTPSTTAGVPDTVSTTTSTVQTGLTMTIESAWDQSTVYGNINISIDELLKLDQFKPDANTTIQLPQTTQRGINTQVRVRPGDAILIGGLVTQKDNYASSGPGFMRPLIPTSRLATTRNTELVFLLRPRVVAFVPGDDDDTVPVSDAPREGYYPKAAFGASAPGDAEKADEKAGAKDEKRVVLEPVPAPPEDRNAEAPAAAKKTSPLPDGISADMLAPRGSEPVTDPQDEAAAADAGRAEEKPADEKDADKTQDKDGGDTSLDTPVPAADMAPVPLAPSAAPKGGLNR